MDVVLIFNGLGNQMSQYAFYLAKKKHDKNLRYIFDPNSTNEHNGSELDEIFGIKYSRTLMDKILVKIYSYRNRPKIWRVLTNLGIHEIREPKNYDFDESYLRKGKFGINFYWGGWHSEKYYSSIIDELKHLYSFPKQDERTFNMILNKINSINSVSLHVRRGDYLKYSEYGNVASLEFYKRSIELIKSKYSDVLFFVFSNDLNWCKTNFIGAEFVFVDCNTAKQSWRDMYLMSQCKYHINANSTFSWWAAWLSPYEGETIVPSKFLHHTITKDIYPDIWTKL